MPVPVAPGVTRLMRGQDGVVSREQLLEAGATPTAVRSWLHHRQLVIVLPGVYVDHTGQPTWQQRAWAAVLYAGPAVLWEGEPTRCPRCP